jgi:hypothetical protein
LSTTEFFSQSLAIAREEKPPSAKGGTRKKKKAAATRKTRRFTGELLAVAMADPLWSGGKDGTIRPVWAMFAGSDQELPVFMANLKTGKKAEFTGTTRYTSRYGSANKVELLKSAGYHFAYQHIEQESGRVSVACVYLPDFFIFDPGMVDPERICFLSLAPRWWIDREGALLRADTERRESVLEHARRLRITLPQHEGNTWTVRLSEKEVLDLSLQAALWAGALDKRTMKPLVPEPAFCLHLYLHALKEGLASFSRAPDYYRADRDDPWDFARSTTQWAWHSRGLPQVGMTQESVATYCTQTQLDDFLSRQIKEYFLLTGQTPRAPRAPLLESVPDPVPWQEGEDDEHDLEEEDEQWA